MEHAQFFDTLWNEYTKRTPSAKLIHELFQSKGESEILNDHIAIRTYNHPEIGVEAMSRPFLAVGYEAKGEYRFEKKKLKAVHFEHKTDRNAPKVFISELCVEELSSKAQETIKNVVSAIDFNQLNTEQLVLQGRVWGTPSHATYAALLEESEYAAWVYVYGFCINHFTVNVNALQNFETLESVNQLLKDNGYAMNTSGGEIKGTPAQLLEQSSTLADKYSVEFQEGTYDIPSCYYEFARRYPQADGELYHGFIASSADKIFESTDVKQAAK
ncbi:DUF1338 domain-containing protein [Sediminitomix flava]|uniref:2-oxoadipate dioxygenase/decarboxylase n=1 Tax=Sediminitomix flava TaxID=379075 RepID=A0A315ZBY7_SEDFL|nr:DUF1338 domain-containing protein [Sediminitomix flava]PWJ42308.1 uncharacterized protein DUF1338 [Sediminitomix flava]